LTTGSRTDLKLIEITLEEAIRLGSRPHNAPLVRDQKEHNRFQAEMKKAYDQLLNVLSEYGEEGDYYGLSDFAIRPDLADRPSVKSPPAYPSRQFIVTVLTERFYRSHFLHAAHRFLTESAPKYRIEITKDFHPSWHVTLYLTLDLARVHCSEASELARLRGQLLRL